MNQRPLKRHRALQPLSREHMSGLVQARNLRRAIGEDRAGRARLVEQLRAAWHSELAPHFADEERLLLPIIGFPSLTQRLEKEHALMRVVAGEILHANGDADVREMVHFAELLDSHIRWEERELFEVIQSCCGEEGLAHLLAEAAAIEAARPGARPRLRLDQPTHV